MTVRFGYPQLGDSFSYLDYANINYGKVKLLKKIGVIDAKPANCLTKLAELRNQFVHKVSNVSMTFEQYISSMDKNQKNKFVNWAGHRFNEDPIVFKGNAFTKRDFVLQNAKFSIWCTAKEILACICLDVDVSERRNQLSLYQQLNNTSN